MFQCIGDKTCPRSHTAPGRPNSAPHSHIKSKPLKYIFKFVLNESDAVSDDK